MRFYFAWKRRSSLKEVHLDFVELDSEDPDDNVFEEEGLPSLMDPNRWAILFSKLGKCPNLEVLQIVAPAIETITFVGASISVDWALSRLTVLTLDAVRCGNDFSFSSYTFPVLVSPSLCAVAEDADTSSVRVINHTGLENQSSPAFRLITPNLRSLKVQGVCRDMYSRCCDMSANPV
jgi:hypothetical protein